MIESSGEAHFQMSQTIDAVGYVDSTLGQYERKMKSRETALALAENLYRKRYPSAGKIAPDLFKSEWDEKDNCHVTLYFKEVKA